MYIQARAVRTLPHVHIRIVEHMCRCCCVLLQNDFGAVFLVRSLRRPVELCPRSLEHGSPAQDHKWS